MSLSKLAYPEVHSSKLFNSATGNFNALFPDFLDVILIYGESASEIISGRQILHHQPTKNDVDEDGERLYPLEVSDRKEKASSSLLLSPLTPAGLAYFRDAERLFRERDSARRLERIGLLACILAHLSPTSKIALSTLAGGRYEAAKVNHDPFAVWQLVLQTHMHGSARTKQRHLADLVTLKQGTMSHPDYLYELRIRSRLVVAAFDSKKYPGYILIDDLLKNFYINGLDQVFFDRVISRLQESMPDATYEDATILAQQYALEHDSPTQSSTSFSGKALVAEVVRTSSSGRYKVLGPYVEGSGFCSHCWANNYSNKHTFASCQFRLPRSARKAALALVASVPPASVPPASVPATVPPVSTGVMSAAPPGSLVSADMALIDEYEHSRYLAARQRLNMGPSTFMCAYAYVCGTFFGSTFFYDNCCSFSLVNNMSFLIDISLLPVPFRIGGIADGIMVTHRGKLPIQLLPAGLNDAFFSAQAQSCLLSLGYIQRAGGSYATVGTDSLFVRDSHGALLDHARLCQNNLYAVSVQRLRVAYSNVLLIPLKDRSVSVAGQSFIGVPVLSSTHVPVTAKFNPADNSSLVDSDINNLPLLIDSNSDGDYDNDDSFSSLSASSLSPFLMANISLVTTVELDHAMSIPTQDSVMLNFSRYQAFGAWQDGIDHVSAEQRERCERADKLHSLAHISDDVLAEAVLGGEFQWAHITPADIRLNRRLRGPCPHCLASKLKNKPMPTSLSPPAAAVGDCICFDLKVLLAKSPGGNLNSLRSVDEFSGDLQISPMLSKSAVNIFNSIMFLVHTRYNAYGHRVSTMVADSEPALLPVIPMLGMHGIVLTLCPPGQHQQRIERCIGFTDDRKVALLYELPFYLPPQYDIFADKWICDVANSVPNSHSRPSTPDILVTGARRVPHYSIPDLKFGNVCMVQQFPIKRAVEANLYAVPVKNIPDAEIGVCLGYSSEVPGAYSFLLANGQVLPRTVAGLVQVHPFDWRPKKVYRAELSLPSVDPRRRGATVVQNRIPSSVDLPVDSGLITTAVPPAISVSNASISIPASLSVSNSLAVDVNPIVDSVVSDQAVDVDFSTPILAQPPLLLSTLVIPPTAVASLPLNVKSVNRFGRETKPLGYWAKMATCELRDIDDWVMPSRVVRLANAKAAYLASPVTRFSVSPSSVSTLSLAAKSSTAGPVCSTRMCPPLKDALVSDQLTAAERLFLDDVIAQNKAYSASLSTLNPSSWYDVASEDDIVLQDCCDYLQSPVAFVARTELDQLKPQQVIKCKEMGLYRAFKLMSMDRLVVATAEHISKLQRLKCLGTEVFQQDTLPTDAVVIGAQVLFKLKDDDRFTCRIAGRGDMLPVDPSLVSFAAVSSDGDKSFALAAMQAHCNIRGERLIISDADVHDAFPQIARPSDSVRLWIKFPKNLPHSLAGSYLEIKGALPGLTESNRLFDLELARVLIEDAGFQNHMSSPRTFVKSDPLDPGLKCIINTHVDDLRFVHNTSTLSRDAIVALEARFGPMRVNSPSLTFTGIECQQLSTGAVMQSQNRYIARLADSVGVSHLPPVQKPVSLDFFKRSVSITDCVLFDPTCYQSLTGSLVQVKTRDDVKHFVSHLCSRNASPDCGDYLKALHVLRYLHSTSEVMRVFSSDSLELSCWADAAYNNASDGRSIGAHFLSVGRNNAPFVSVVKLLAVPTSPTDAEYMNTLPAAKLVMHFRFLSDFLGWPQGSVPMYLDSQTAINLAEAPQISKKSLHLDVKHHFIRDCFIRGFIHLVHVPADQQRANVITKVLTAPSYQRQRSVLLNLAAWKT